VRRELAEIPAPIAEPPAISASERARSGLAVVTAVAGGDAARIPELTAFLTEQRVPARAYRRLDDQAAALAGTLARIQTAKARDRAAARPTLEALRAAIDAILKQG
jgi:hypothetical protein